jgi:hypothetical protein
MPLKKDNKVPLLNVTSGSESKLSVSLCVLNKKLTTTTRGSPLVQKNGFLSSWSNRTPKQLIKKYINDNEHQKLKEIAYGWAVDLVYSEERQMTGENEKDRISLATIAKMATDCFHIEILRSTLSTLKAKGASTVQKQGKHGKVSEEELADVAEAVLSFVAISQINGDPEVQAKAAMAVLHKIYGESQMTQNLRFLWGCIK